jgi:hypothetical protein
MMALVLAMVPSYPAAVRVGTKHEAPVWVRNHQGPGLGNLRQILTRTGHTTAGWNLTASPF